MIKEYLFIPNILKKNKRQRVYLSQEKKVENATIKPDDFYFRRNG